MKLFIVTCIREYREVAKEIFQDAGIRIMSITETVGVRSDRDQNLLDDWFGNKDGEFLSLILFSFAPSEQIDLAIQQINRFNEREATGFPVRAFVLPVESSNLPV